MDREGDSYELVVALANGAAPSAATRDEVTTPPLTPQLT